MGRRRRIRERIDWDSGSGVRDAIRHVSPHGQLALLANHVGTISRRAWVGEGVSPYHLSTKLEMGWVEQSGSRLDRGSGFGLLYAVGVEYLAVMYRRPR